MNHAVNQHLDDKSSFLRCLQGSWVDRGLLIGLLIVIIGLWFYIQNELNDGEATAYIYHQQQLLAVYPLPTDEQVIQVAAVGELGISDIEISRLGIRFRHSPCATQYCTASGHKNYTGSVIACVPNHIMVVLRGSMENNHKSMTFDAITE